MRITRGRRIVTPGLSQRLKTRLAAADKRTNAAKSSECSPKTLRKLSNDRVSEVRRAALVNPNLPTAAIAAVIKRARGSRTFDMKFGANADLLHLILNPALTSTTLHDIAQLMVHGQARPTQQVVTNAIVARVLSHPNCPTHWLQWGAERGVWQKYLNHAVADNTRIPDNIAVSLSHRGDPGTYKRLAGNPGVPEAILATLVPVADERTLMILVARLTGTALQKCVDMLLQGARAQPTTCRSLAAQYSKDPSQIAALCLDRDPEVRSWAIKNPLVTDADLVGAALIYG